VALLNNAQYKEKRNQGYRIMRFIIKLVSAVCLLCVASCGWHLRSQTSLPLALQDIVLNSKASKSFNIQLTHQLNQLNSRVWRESNKPKKYANLSISSIYRKTNTLSLNSLGQISEYELIVEIEASLLTETQDKTWVFSARQVINNNITNILSTQRELNAQAHTMEDELIQQLIYRLQYFR
jgi:outer membrane lipopolysaccharide assembly protein LptE/RlpB